MGLMHFEAAHTVEITKLVEYIDSVERPINTGCLNTPTQHRLSGVTDS
jgi:hypothetical protein